MHKIAPSMWRNAQAPMDWSNLRYFLALARNGSLSAASKVLGTDHTTVARRVQALEKELGLQLVDRRGRAYRPTPPRPRACAPPGGRHNPRTPSARLAHTAPRTAPQGPVFPGAR